MGAGLKDGQRDAMSNATHSWRFRERRVAAYGEWRLGDAPFKDEPTEGFICPRRAAQSPLKELHFLLQTLQTGTHAGITTLNLADIESKNHIWWICLTLISLSALARSFSRDAMSSLVFFTSVKALCN